MNQIREENLEERIVELFRKESVSTIVLAGKAGIGKSWMARKVSLFALKQGVFDLSLWVYMSVKQTERDLYHSIAGQLSIYSTLREEEIDGSIESADHILEENLEALQSMILARLSRDRLLLVLDDEGKRMTKEENVIIGLLRFLPGNTSKLLITSVNEDGRYKSNGGSVVIDLKPLGPEKSLSLLQQKTGTDVFEIPGARNMVEGFLNRNISLTPAEVVVLAKLISSRRQESGLEGLKSLMEDLQDGNCNLPLTFPSSKWNMVSGGFFVDFNWLASHFLREQGAMHYNELIAYWSMEGYLGDVDRIDEAYEKGHRILMELIDLHVLKTVGANYLSCESTVLDLKDRHHPGFGRGGSLGLANACANFGIGEVVHTDGMIATPSARIKARNLSTLLLDGNSLSRDEDIIKDFLNYDEKMQVLGLFCPRIISLPQPVSEMKSLSVLILRGCDFLMKIDSIEELRLLTVLEVSGSKSLTVLPDEVFAHQAKLQSLNLSGLQIEMLPTSAYDLTEIQWLILKGCSNIKSLRSMKKWKKLEVLDLSGAVSFKNFAETSFKAVRKLQFLDVSHTRIRSLPFLSEISELTHLSVSGCRNLFRLPSIQSLSKLQFLDVSGSGIKELQNNSFQKNVSLNILDLSSIAILVLPFNISTHHFYLKDCSQVKKMNRLLSPENLEVLDLSGASNLVDIDDRFFEKMKTLRFLNLSRTKVKVLPPLSDCHSLRELSLSCCLDLAKLPALNSLSKLEVLDLSGCRALTALEDENFRQLSWLRQIDFSETSIKALPDLSSLSNLKELKLRGLSSITNADFLEHMTKLEILDLSDTGVRKVPETSCFQNLTNLSLRNCRDVEIPPNLESCTRLEILDLSGTSITHLPSLKGLKKLRKLLLKDCLSLKVFSDINPCDLSGVVMRDLPYGISDLTELDQLALPHMQDREGSETEEIKRLNECHWAISSLNEKVLDNNGVSLSLFGSEFLKFLEKNPSLWKERFWEFHFSVHPIQLQHGIGGLYFQREECRFKDIYLKSMHCPHLEEQFRLLEIHGFDSFPNGVENLLIHAKHLFLLDSSFIKSLADLGSENLRMMRGCWIARCQNMESLMNADSAKDSVGLVKCLEILWISSAPSLKNLHPGYKQGDCFQNLKRLYLDCCSRLSSIVPHSQFLQNLEVLHVKFCDGLKTLFDPSSEMHTLPNLHELYLWELPGLERIDCITPFLLSLKVGRCPLLEHVLASTFVPENLKFINVQRCDNLSTLVEGMTEGNCQLPSLERIELWGLPELTNIGIASQSIPGYNIKDCPKLQSTTIFS